MSNSQPQPVSLPLSTYPLEKLIQLWRNEELTAEQMIGHLLQHVARLDALGQAFQKEVQRLQKSNQ